MGDLSRHDIARFELAGNDRATKILGEGSAFATTYPMIVGRRFQIQVSTRISVARFGHAWRR